jgi:hypothetical protein
MDLSATYYRRTVMCCASLALCLLPTPPQARPTSTRATPAPITLQWRPSADNLCHFGPALAPYFARAQADLNKKQASDPNGGDEDQIGVAPVNRRWGGVTITAVVVGYETSDVYFAEPLPRLLAQAQQAGLAIIKREDDRALIYEGDVVSGFASATRAGDRRFGRSIWFCGN